MNKEWAMVREFQQAFENPVAEKPVKMPPDRAAKRYNWMLEELDEFLEADNLCDQSDAMIDLIYFALGTLVEMGVKPDKLFELVHKANMTKLWPDGKPRRRADGKTLKPENWIDPFPLLQQELERQKNAP